MKKILTYWLMIFVLVMASVLTSCGEGVTETGNPTTGNTDGTDSGDSSSEDGSDSGDDGEVGANAIDEEQACLDEGGEFVEFSDGCAALCGTDADSICTQAITESCDCGEGFCWNADTFECEEDL
jgi:hypothetical protein